MMDPKWERRGGSQICATTKTDEIINVLKHHELMQQIATTTLVIVTVYSSNRPFKKCGPLFFTAQIDSGLTTPMKQDVDHDTFGRKFGN